MTTTISHASTTVQPTLVLGYRSERQSGNRIHAIIGTGSPDVTFGPPTLRTGTLEIFCLSWAEAAAIETLHTLPGKFTLTDSETLSVGMTYVPSGAIVSELDDATRTRWVVSVDYQEVTP